MGSMPGGQVLFLPRDSSGGAIPRKRPEIHSRPDLVHATERALVSSGSVVPPGPAMPGMAAHAESAPAEIASPAQPEETKGREEEIVSGMYKEIQNLLRYSA